MGTDIACVEQWTRRTVALKPREPRQKVLIHARMRVGASWSDACILNLSPRGMLVQSQSAPDRGNYLEIRRGQHVVVARVVWSSGQRFGVHTQDIIRPDELTRDTDNSSARSLAQPERRVAPRSMVTRHESSRQRGRAFEFCTLAALGLGSAFLLFATIAELLARPLATIETALIASRSG